MDLATLRPVGLRLLPRAPPIEEIEWAARCAALFDLADPAIERLVDYGVASSGSRFEATCPPCTSSPRGGRSASGTLARATARLHLGRLSAGRIDVRRIVGPPGGRYLLIDDRTGYPLPEDREIVEKLVVGRRGGPSRDPAAQSVRRPSAELNGLAAELAELLDGARSTGVRALDLRASTPELLELAWLLAARLARVHGYAAVAAEALLRWPWLSGTLMGRHVALFDPPTVSESSRTVVRDRVASLVLALGRASARPHVVLRPRVSERASWAGRSVELIVAGSAVDTGDSARHADTLLPVRSPRSVSRGLAAGVREVSEVYESARPSSRTVRIRLKVSRALEASRGGRHAAGHRLLRDAIGGLDRRGDRIRAAEAAVALGRLLLERGRVDEAIEAFGGAGRRFGAALRSAEAAAAQTFVGLAATDAGRLHEAEATLRSALHVAEAAADGDVRDQASLALARCLFWQRRHDEASALVARLQPASAWQAVIRLRLRARLALARLDLPTAGRTGWAALKAAVEGADPLEVSSCHAVVADVEARAGNVRGLRAHVAEGLRAARLGHGVQRAWRLRLTLVEGLLHVGERPAARTAAIRMARGAVSHQPALLRARICRALAAAMPESDDAVGWRARVRAAVRDQDVVALDDLPAEVPCMDVIEELIEVLAVCQETDDEPGRSEIGSRVTETGLLIPPARSVHGLEAGAPVRYGGEVVAALTCRWGPDQSPARPRVEALLATAAAACAPSVRIALDRLVVSVQAPRPDDLEILGVSQGAAEMRAAVTKAAAAPFPVLVTGESGSGKEVVARAIHRAGPRRDQRFAALNCAALNDELIEAELFGHARGAFSGAFHERVGLFEEASGGTLFLDEVSELSARGQAKLLRTLQEGEIRRVGENFTRRVDVRLVAATNRDLWADVAEGRFRRDLLYRLDVIRLLVPPLRARVEDIGLLAAHFWVQSTGRLGSRATLTPDVLAALARYDWPGNVRELQNVMAALAVAAPPRGRVGVSRLSEPVAGAVASPEASGRSETLDEARRTFERHHVRAAMARAGGHQGRAAATLGLTRQGLAKLLARLELA